MKEKCAAVDAYSAQRKVWLPINCALAYKAVKPLNEGGGAERRQACLLHPIIFQTGDHILQVFYLNLKKNYTLSCIENSNQT